MSSNGAQSPAHRFPLLDWLKRANAHIAEWAAAMAWWRMGLLFLLILIAASMVSSKLGLKHEWTRIVQPAAKRADGVDITIGGKDGIRITERGVEKTLPKPPLPPGAGNDNNNNNNNNNSPRTDAEPDPNPNPNPLSNNDDDDDDRVVTKRVWTFRGFLGDVGATILILLFAYLTAAKIVVRKVAQADEKVRSAVDKADREAMERQLAQAQLQLLQAQVEPHFLFNTLAAVDYLIETEPARASQMQKKLIAYLRGALPQMREDSSTLGREMSLIRPYLDLIQMRIEERLQVEIDVPEDLEDAEFPPMMLQSLVENAIRHGIEPKPEGGRVTVAAKIQRGMLWVEVRDTGVGIGDLDLDLAPPKGTGIGLRNIRERLAKLYPGKGRFTIMSDDRTGTVVRIGVPYRVRDEAPEAQEQPA
jgi:signal transduction histidine kinase